MEPNQTNQQPNPASTPVPGTSENTLLGILSYIGPLVIISLLLGKDNPSVKFHVKQGLVLFIIEVIISFLMPMMWPFWFILHIINLALLVLSIIGIINVIHHREKELPLVGNLAKKFKF